VRRYGLSTAERFWQHVDRSGECWVWTRAKIKGYGAFRLDGRTVYAHRIAWELEREPAVRPP
jgi:hypothetical protein